VPHQKLMVKWNQQLSLMHARQSAINKINYIDIIVNADVNNVQNFQRLSVRNSKLLLFSLHITATHYAAPTSKMTVFQSFSAMQNITVNEPILTAFPVATACV
jgi:hypothetical protein